MGGGRQLVGALAIVATVAASCATSDDAVVLSRPAAETTVTAAVSTTDAPLPTSTETTTTLVPTTESSTSTSTTPPPTTIAPAAVVTPAAVAAPREVVEQQWTPFATAGDGDVVLHHPVWKVERIGFHESGHDGARDLAVVSTAARPLVLESRDRGTGAQTAADIVVAPDHEVRAPVTGTVVRAGTYTLYCKYSDDYAVIEPDRRPGWEVKVFHIDGVAVRAGDRVEAGITVLATRATVLPFESQVDEHTAEPSWPHVHVEVVDPSIPDRPGQGC